jgi:hypothetical protein
MEQMFVEKKFISIDKEHIINTSVLENIAWFQIELANFSHYKTFFLLVKDSIDYFRNNNIKYIKQSILISDAQSFKFSEFVEIDESIGMITTPIEKFIDELVCALGIDLI